MYILILFLPFGQGGGLSLLLQVAGYFFIIFFIYLFFFVAFHYDTPVAQLKM